MRRRQTYPPINETAVGSQLIRRRIATGLLLALLACGVVIRSTEGACSCANLPRNPGSHVVLQQALPGDVGCRGGGAEGTAPNNNRRRRHYHARGQATRDSGGPAAGPAAVGAEGILAGAEGVAYPDAVEVSGSDPRVSSGTAHLDGVYLREWDVNGAPHFKRRSTRGSRTAPVHLFFTGKEWMLHLDVDTDLDINHCLAYSEVPELNPLKTTRKWSVRVGDAWVRRPHMRLAETTPDAEVKGLMWNARNSRDFEPGDSYSATWAKEERQGFSSSSTSSSSSVSARQLTDDAALTRRLLPLYLVFVLDAVGLGVALPALPFFVMSLKATALQLAIVVSSNYIAQTFGCVITGNLSDVVGRKPVVICCLLGTVVSHIMVARSTTLGGVAWGRIIGGITGGLTPIAQAAVADVVPVQSLPKFLGRIQACVGLGFVLGPLTMTILQRLLKVSTAHTFFAAAVFPLAGLIYALLRMPETKPGATGVTQFLRALVPVVPAPARARAPSQRRQRDNGDFSISPSHSSVSPAVRTSVARERTLDSSRRRRRRRKRTAVASLEEGPYAGERGVIDGGSGEFAGGYEYAHQMAVQTGMDVEEPADEVEDVGHVDHVGHDGGFGGGAAGAVGATGVEEEREIIPRAVMLLVGNGFLLMYAFSIETIYAMFLKDNFGYGESVLSMVFALNGLAVGALQLFGMRHLVRLLGKHVMLILGNVLLAMGMVGMALSRQPVIHFALFTVHIMGFSLADTALAALISRYASPATQGRSMGLNQAAQSMSRVVSPVVAGVLYECSKQRNRLPLGSLPYLVGSAFPLAGVAVPFWLYLRSVDAKKRKGVYTRGGWSISQDVQHDNANKLEMRVLEETFSHEKNL